MRELNIIENVNRPSDPEMTSNGSTSPRAITKILVPGRRTGLLQRPRLIDFLLEHIDRKLLLVSAPAGYGKTSLLIDLAHETTLPVCWYSLDPSDSDPRTFLEYLVASIRRLVPDFGKRTLRLLSDSPALPPSDIVVGTLITEIFESIPRFFVLVLDDYHTVEESSPVNQLLDALLRLLPENAHIVLSSRTLPSELTLTRLTARQEIAGLGANDLRFTPEEIRQLVKQNYQADLTEQQAAELAEQSEGWITGILLTTHSLWKGLFHDLVRTKGSDRQVFAYLATEVLAQQPSDLKRFLLETSVLDQLSAELCNALLGTRDAAGMLRLVEQRNLFTIRLEGDGTWYRYHHLFQDFLRNRLAETEPTRWRDLQLRAAAICKDRGEWDQVISHYLSAGCIEEAANAIDRVAKSQFDAGHIASVAKWIDALPPDTLDLHPGLLVIRAMILTETGARERALDVLDHAFSVFHARGDSIGLANTLIQQAVCRRYEGRYEEAIQHCRQALALLPEGRIEERAKAHRLIGTSYGLLGDWPGCIEELETALRYFEAAHVYSHVAWLHHDLGVACRTAGKPDAERHFQAALEFWGRAKNPVGMANTLNSIGVGYHRQGDYERAIETLEKAREQARQCGQLYTEALALLSLGDVYRETGEFARALEDYRGAFELAKRINEGFIITYALSALGEVFRLTGDFQTAGQLLHQALDQASSHRSNYEIGLAETAMGILSYESGDAGAASEQLEHAARLLEQGRAKRDGARAHLHLAQTHFLQRKYRQVKRHLLATADLASQLREDQFIVMDRHHLMPLLTYAASKRIAHPYYARVLEKIQSLPSASTDSRPVTKTAQSPQIQARAFGAAVVLVDGCQVTAADWDSAVTKELFFLLLAHPQGLRKEQIQGILWPEVHNAKANGIFHSTVYRMRRALYPECLIHPNGQYQISPEMRIGYDVADFEGLISQAAKEGNRERQAELFLQATELYNGEYLEDSYNDWCLPIRNALREQFLSALLALGILYETAGQTQEAIDMFERLLKADCLREDVYRRLMELHLREGNRTLALRTYNRCLDVLRDEAQLSPNEETLAVYRKITS